MSNRCVTTFFHQGVTPHESWRERLPSFEDLLLFDTVGIMKKRTTPEKLGRRGAECILLGKSSNHPRNMFHTGRLSAGSIMLHWWTLGAGVGYSEVLYPKRLELCYIPIHSRCISVGHTSRAAMPNTLKQMTPLGTFESIVLNSENSLCSGRTYYSRARACHFSRASGSWSSGEVSVSQNNSRTCST